MISHITLIAPSQLLKLVSIKRLFSGLFLNKTFNLCLNGLASFSQNSLSKRFRFYVICDVTKSYSMGWKGVLSLFLALRG